MLRIDKEKIRDNALGFIATGAFSGFCPKFPGAAGSLAGAAVWWLAGPLDPRLQFLVVLAALAAGWYAARTAQDWWGQDDRRIVIGDMAGIWLTLATFDRNIGLWIAGFVIFRLVDAVKFYPALHCRWLGPGWGLMAEKAVAGAYAGALLTVASVFFSRFPGPDLLLARLAAYGTVIAAVAFSHLYGSLRGGLGIASIAFGCLLFWIWAPGNPWFQAAILVLAAAGMAAAIRFTAGEPWFLTIADCLLLMWACWLSLWFLPKLPMVVVAGAVLMAVFRHIRPYPTNYLPGWGLEASMIAPNIIAAIYTGAVLQVAVMMFGGGEMVFIRYAVIGILRLFNIRG